MTHTPADAGRRSARIAVVLATVAALLIGPTVASAAPAPVSAASSTPGIVCERVQEPVATTDQATDDAAGRAASEERAQRQVQPGRANAIGSTPGVGEGWRFSWGAGRMTDVSFLSRTNALLSGRAFAPDPAHCPGPRPLVVIATGLLANDTLYWWAAQSLAEAGYVVMTFDFQGQGLSEQNGHTNPDGTGQPLPPACGEGLCDRGPDGIAGFLTDMADAVDFALSTPAMPYAHAVSGQPGLESFPYADVVDPSRVGLAGHSAGGRTVSVLQGIDERVDAVVAWDNLATDLRGDRSSSSSQCVTGGLGVSAQPAVPRVPAFGHAAPNNTLCGDEDLKLSAYEAWSSAGLPTGLLVVAGTRHTADWSPTPAAPATHRYSTELHALHTIAWFDRFLLGDRTALAVFAADEVVVQHHYDGPITITRDQIVDLGFRSAFSVPGELECADVRTGCVFLPPAAPGEGEGDGARARGRAGAGAPPAPPGEPTSLPPGRGGSPRPSTAAPEPGDASDLRLDGSTGADPGAELAVGGPIERLARSEDLPGAPGALALVFAGLFGFGVLDAWRRWGWRRAVGCT